MNSTALIDRARYRHTLFGHLGGGRWRFDSWSMQTMEEQLARGDLSEYTFARLVEEIPVAVVAECVATPTPPTRGHCDGYGNIHLGHDSDYDCGGCVGCRREKALIGWTIGAFLWALATGSERAELEPGVRGMQALAAVGRAVAAAGSPGFGVSRWLCDTVAEWNAVRVGRWYRVAGRRGKAKEHHGAEGEVMRLEESPGRLGARGTLRVALRPHGAERWIWVPASALAPIREPVDVARAKREAEARRATRTPFAGAKGDAVYVIDGLNAGRNGTVMWTGFSRGEQRVGVRFGHGERDIAWCSARDVAAAQDLVTVTASISGDLTEAESEMALDLGARAVLADSLEARGFLGLAMAWRGPIPVVDPPRARGRRGVRGHVAAGGVP